MKSQTSQKSIDNIARSKSLSKEAVEEICKSQFRRVRLTLAEMNHDERYYPIIQLPNWGKFLVTEKRKMKDE